MNTTNKLVIVLALTSLCLVGCDPAEGGASTSGTTGTTGTTGTDGAQGTSGRDDDETSTSGSGVTSGEGPSEAGSGSETGTGSGGPVTEPGWCWEPNHGEYPCECAEEGEVEACTTDDKEEGVSVCVFLDYKDVSDGAMYSECGPCGPAEQQACEAIEGGMQFCTPSAAYAPPRPAPYSWGPCLDPASMECIPGEVVRCSEGDAVCEVDSRGVPRLPC